MMRREPSRHPAAQRLPDGVLLSAVPFPKGCRPIAAEGRFDVCGLPDVRETFAGLQDRRHGEVMHLDVMTPVRRSAACPRLPRYGLLGDHSRRSRGPRHRPAGGSRCVGGPGRKLPWARPRRRQKARHGRRGGISASAVAARVQLATPAFAHTWLTLRPSVAGRLVLPGRAPAAQGAPVLRPAICENTGGKLGVPRRP